MLKVNVIFRSFNLTSKNCIINSNSIRNNSYKCKNNCILLNLQKPKRSSFSVFREYSSFSTKGPRNIKDNILPLCGIVIASGSIIFGLFFDDIFRRTVDYDVGDEKVETKEVRIPSESKDIPSKIPYLLIGGGTASFSAFRAIKSNDPRAKVLVITDELYHPYMRPPLSKEMWLQEDDEFLKKFSFIQWNGVRRSLFYEPEEFYVGCESLENSEKGGVAVARGWKVVRIDPNERKAYLDDGKVIEYDKCLIATGVRPSNIPIFENTSQQIKNKVSLYRNIVDFEKLHKILVKGSKSIAIVGGGFLGSELSAVLAKKGEIEGFKVHLVFPEKGCMDKVLPYYLSGWTTNKIKDRGVNVISNVDVTNVALSSDNNRVLLNLSDGNKIEADHVIVSAGSEVNTDLAKESGLEVDPVLGGYMVNSEMEARSNLYCAGDCISFYDAQLGRRRIEHHDHAVVTGRLAGENMVGAGKSYVHQSMFWSELGSDVSYEAVGITDSQLPTVGVFAKPDANENKNEKKQAEKPEGSLKTSQPKEGEKYEKGVLFYLRDDVIVGILLWNLFNKMTIARQVLSRRKKFDDLNEVAKLFEIHEE